MAWWIMSWGCRQNLPDAQSYAARLYVARCGQCHTAYSPRSLTGAMWEVQVEMMDARMRQAGLPALSEEEKRAILSYLKKNAAR